MNKLSPVALGILAALAYAQPANPPEPIEVTPEILDARQRLWLQNRPRSYDLKLERTCFCAPRLVELNFQVRGFSSRLVGRNPGLERASVQGWVSVDKLYGSMRKTLSEGGAVRAVFDGRGVPAQITLDPLPQATDDEQYLTVSVTRR